MPQATRRDLSRLISRDIRYESQHAGWRLDHGFKALRWEDNKGNKAFEDMRRYRSQQVAKIKTPKIYRAAFERFLQTTEAETFVSRDFQCTSRLIVGTGIDSITEFGIQLDHTYGMPLLPGSSLKGLARHYTLLTLGGYEGANEKENPIPEAHSVAPDSDLNPEFLPGPRMSPEGAAKLSSELKHTQYTHFDLLFGRADLRGLVSFHNAWIIPESDPSSPFLPDVLTPHHQSYYGRKTYKKQDGNEDVYPPADWDEPVPVPFVTVRPGAKFRVVIEGPRQWAELAMDILASAAKDWGIGAKTNAGYGRMHAPSAIDELEDIHNKLRKTARAKSKEYKKSLSPDSLFGRILELASGSAEKVVEAHAMYKLVTDKKTTNKWTKWGIKNENLVKKLSDWDSIEKLKKGL